MNTPNTNIFKKLKSDFIVCTKLTVVLGFVFILINQEFTVRGMGMTFLISAMYSFTLGLGNGIINEYLNSKWDWVKETNKRVWVGMFTTIVYTGVAVLIIHYVQYIMIFGHKIENFFTGSLVWVHLFAFIFSLGVAAFFHAKGFMDKWKSAMTQESTKQEIVAKTETAHTTR